MPVRIRLSRKGAKKRPFYRIVVADSRRARDGKFLDQLGTYNPMLAKDDPERVKIAEDKAKDWIAKGAQPSDRVKIFLSNIGMIDKPIITKKTKQHLPKKKNEKADEVKAAQPAKAAEETQTEKADEVKAAQPAKAAQETQTEKADEVKAAQPAEEKNKKMVENSNEKNSSKNNSDQIKQKKDDEEQSS